MIKPRVVARRSQVNGKGDPGDLRGGAGVVSPAARHTSTLAPSSTQLFSPDVTGLAQGTQSRLRQWTLCLLSHRELRNRGFATYWPKTGKLRNRRLYNFLFGAKETSAGNFGERKGHG